MSLIPCTCDACGKKATCRQSLAAPRGWFFMKVYGHPDDDEDAEMATVLACSEACKTKLPWKRVAKVGAR